MRLIKCGGHRLSCAPSWATIDEGGRPLDAEGSGWPPQTLSTTSFAQAGARSLLGDKDSAHLEIERTALEERDSLQDQERSLSCPCSDGGKGQNGHVPRGPASKEDSRPNRLIWNPSANTEIKDAGLRGRSGGDGPEEKLER